MPIITLIFLIASDQLSKWKIEEKLAINDHIDIIPGFFSIVHVKNSGAAFGFLGGIDSGYVSIGFAVVAVIAMAVIWNLYRLTPPGDIVTRVAFVLIAGGAAGNLIDRIRYGAVTDFLLFYIGDYRWPAFNVADSCITIGVTLLAYRIVFKYQTRI